jgi:hypothetical protein
LRCLMLSSRSFPTTRSKFRPGHEGMFRQLYTSSRVWHLSRKSFPIR